MTDRDYILPTTLYTSLFTPADLNLCILRVIIMLKGGYIRIFCFCLIYNYLLRGIPCSGKNSFYI